MIYVIEQIGIIIISIMIIWIESDFQLVTKKEKVIAFIASMIIFNIIATLLKIIVTMS